MPLRSPSELYKCRSMGTLFITILLCLGILLQILGVPVSFWDLNGSDDPFTTSLMIGFAVLPSRLVESPLLQCIRAFTKTEPSYQRLRQYMLFHPPLSRS